MTLECQAAPDAEVQRRRFAREMRTGLAMAHTLGTNQFRALAEDALGNLEQDARDVTGDAWMSHVNMMAYKVPDVGRDRVDDKDRAKDIKWAESMIKVVRTNTETLVEEWKQVTAYERDRRTAQEEKRELIRVIIRSWREVADGRRARSVLGSAYDLPNAYMTHFSYQSTPDVIYPTGERGARHRSANVMKNMEGGSRRAVRQESSSTMLG